MLRHFDETMTILILHFLHFGALEEAGSVAVLPLRYAPMGPGLTPNPGAICAFGF